MSPIDPDGRYLIVTMSDGDWIVPLAAIAAHRAALMIGLLGSDGDTANLFATDAGAPIEWARDHMAWPDLSAVATRVAPPPPANHVHQWPTAPKQLVTNPAGAPRSPAAPLRMVGAPR